jgi:plastocyanin
MMRALPCWIAVALTMGDVSAHAGSVAGTATMGGSPAVNAVVYLQSARPSPIPSIPPHVAMDQKNLTFVPAVLPVMRGTVVEFTNGDDVQHNVFTPSALAGKFNLGTHGPGDVHSITFTQPGDVLILCNIHMEMEAHVLVLDDPYFATVARDGSYHIRDVPAGTYTLKIWRKRWSPFTQTVDVPATGDVTIDIATGS